MNFSQKAQLILLISLISLGIGASLYKKKKLNECAISKKAAVVNIDKRLKRGYFIRYKYLVEGVVYEVTESISNKIELETFKTGDSIDVFISCTNHSISSYKKN